MWKNTFCNIKKIFQLPKISGKGRCFLPPPSRRYRPTYKLHANVRTGKCPFPAANTTCETMKCRCPVVGMKARCRRSLLCDSHDGNESVSGSVEKIGFRTSHHDAAAAVRADEPDWPLRALTWQPATHAWTKAV